MGDTQAHWNHDRNGPGDDKEIAEQEDEDDNNNDFRVPTQIAGLSERDKLKRRGMGEVEMSQIGENSRMLEH